MVIKAIDQETHWAVTEFMDADLHDVRRTQRLIEIATVLAAYPGASFPEACGDKAMLKATYRFFDNDAIEPQAILESHIDASGERICKVDRVLAVQDTTEVKLTHHPSTEQVGPLRVPQQRGLFVHSTLAITPERVPLGLLAQQVWARDEMEVSKAAKRKQLPIDQKESYKWLESLQAVLEIGQEYPDVHFVSIGDREADVYDLFLVDRPSNVDILVRAAWDRRVDHPEKHLWQRIQHQALAGSITIEIPRRGKQVARKATLEIRFTEVMLSPPKHRKSEDLPVITVWAIQALETNAPEGQEPIEWLLLSTFPVNSFEEAIEKLDWYCCRWGIEIFHRVLKSGCKIEARQFETAERLKRALPIFSVIAWRILYATMLSRTLPEAPATAILEPDEWQALYCRIHQTTQLPEQAPTLHQAIRWIARLGGFPDRRGDGEPGATVLWKGFQHLTDLTVMYRILRPPPTHK
jgi:hypothetical protein